MRSSTIRRSAALAATAALTVAVLPLAQADPVKPPRLSADAITAKLAKTVNTPGTAWQTEPDGTVLVSYDSTVTGAKLSELTSVTRRLGDGVKLEKLPGKLQKYRSGGESIFGGEYKCSMGFNVIRKGRYSFLTAGHCANEASTWYADVNKRSKLGTRQHSSYPGNDYALINYPVGVKQPGGGVYLYNGKSQDITRATTPAFGTYVYRAGATTGLRSGRVRGLNATVNYGDGPISGLIRTSVCAEQGDSGGPLFSGRVAYGLTSGGTGDCKTPGGVTYFQPVVEALQAYGVAVY
ncbi:trypsin-like serine protease [Kribbella sandramycini]|uniref:Streptogrisin A/streptogrisin D n=1 Tax=Kribbella sandramycini TaxID=60450 RepID=A0A7Y4L442_9ACTN|nr:S1 family peptidase [Kribbella sandramycini]MBB6566502.1 streptogrisin A/streptogrisin D [Kribbella sandramycini]NOL42841.1 trypsin-like serine protease [Kribbella sandramycini]